MLDATAVQPPCLAPTRALYVLPDGTFRACCAGTYALGHVETDGLLEVWRSARRQALVDAIAVADYSLGCTGCGLEIEREGPEHAYPRQFDRLAPRAGDDPDLPGLLGLYFANTCNLQCVQCHGGNSSTIRSQREKLPPIRPRYDDRFFDDLRTMLPAATHAVFAGGEPFLIPEAHRSWELIAEVAPDLACTIITNGTQWNDRVAHALATVRASVVLSLDGATKETFEAIRVGADFDRVMEHLDHLGRATAAAGTTLSINFCLMVQNHHEFGDVLTLAEERGIAVDVSVVREPAAVSIYAQPPDVVRTIHDRLVAQDADVSARLDRNLPIWRAELDRIEQWLRDADDDLAPWAPQAILGFNRAGTGPTTSSAARAELEALGHGPVHEVIVGPGDVIVEIDGATKDALQAGGDLIGRPAAVLWELLAATHGKGGRMEQTARDDDSSRLEARFPAATAHAATVALRDASGRADRAAVLFVVGPPAGERASSSDDAHPS